MGLYQSKKRNIEMASSDRDQSNLNANEPQYNRGGFITFIFTMVFVLAFFIYLTVIHPGVDMGEKVKEVASGADAVAVKEFDISTVKEPWIENADVAQYGEGIYKANCAMCHGENGMGDGAAGAALKPKPRDLVEGKWTVGGDSISLFKTISDGIPGTSMAGFTQIKIENRWALVQYIRSITKNKVNDESSKLGEFAATAK